MKFLPRFRDLRIRTKLALLVTLMVGGIAIFIWQYFPARQERQGKDAIEEKARSIAEMTAFSVGPALVFDDPLTIAESFEAAGQNQDLAFIAVLDDTGRVVASHNLSADDRDFQLRVRAGEHTSPDGALFAVTTPIIFEGRTVGEVCVGLSLGHLRGETDRSRTAITVVSIAVFLVGMLLALAISSVITVPLHRMVDTAQRIAGGDLTLRVRDASGDEVGLLARAFNEMVGNLEEARRDLAGANRGLEERVEQRTRELRKEVTHRTKIEGVLRQQIAAIETSVDGMAIIDTDGGYVFLNLAFARLYGHDDPGELIGVSWQSQYGEDERARFRREIMPAVSRDGQWRGEAQGTKGDGSGFPQELSVSSVPGGGLVFVVHDISARKRAEAELIRAAERFRNFFDNALVGFFQCNDEGDLLAANPTLARILGFESPEAMRDARLNLQRNFFVASARRTEFRALVLSQSAALGFEAQVHRRDGSPIWVSINARAFRGNGPGESGFEGTIADVSKRRKAEDSQNKLLRAVEQTDEVVFITELDGTITYVNPAFETLYGFSREEALGKTPRILKSGLCDAAHYALFWENLLAGKGVRGEYVNRTRAGELVTIEGSVSPIITAEGTLSGFIGVQKNVTMRKQEEEKRKALEAQLAQAQKIESIGTLAGGIAHDFNNILAIILGHAGILEMSGNHSPALSRSVQAITTAVQRGAGIVRQILTFARKTEASVESLRVNEIIRELVKMLEATFPKNISLVEEPSGTDPLVRADRTQLHQTLLNLCVNARDAMPAGGAITLSTEVVDQALLRNRHPEASAGSYALLSVQDTGSGMDRQTVERIFEPFFTTKEKGKGTGLGLAVVYGIVKSHNGFIDVVSEPGKGSTFRIYLPLEGRVEKAAVVEAGAEALPRGTETILVAEDEEMLLMFLESVLKSFGYTVLGARDGRTALDLFRAHMDEIALVITDLDMPGVDGLELIARIREEKPACRTMLASGFIDPQVREQLGRDGVRHILVKPYVPAHLMQKIREALA